MRFVQVASYHLKPNRMKVRRFFVQCNKGMDKLNICLAPVENLLRINLWREFPLNVTRKCDIKGSLHIAGLIDEWIERVVCSTKRKIKQN